MDQIHQIADFFKALSDPTRLRIVMMLGECGQGVCEGGSLCVNALARKLNVSQSAVSQHLRILRQAGLVRGMRQGNFMHYSLDRDGIEKYRNGFRETLGSEFDLG